MTKLAFEPHRIKREQLKPLHDHVIVHEMSFDGTRKLNSGIILPNDNGKGYGIRPRWGKVYAKGPDQTSVDIDQWIMVAHGRWTRGIEIEDENGPSTLRRIDPNDILLVSTSSEAPSDDTQSDAVHIDKR